MASFDISYCIGFLHIARMHIKNLDDSPVNICPSMILAMTSYFRNAKVLID